MMGISQPGDRCSSTASRGVAAEDGFTDASYGRTQAAEVDATDVSKKGAQLAAVYRKKALLSYAVTTTDCLATIGQLQGLAQVSRPTIPKLIEAA